MQYRYLALPLLVSAVCACTPIIMGSVVPMENSQYQSVAEAKTKTEAMNIMDGDAKLTCQQNHSSNSYSVVTQNTNILGQPDNASTGVAWADAAVKIARATGGAPRQEDNTRYEVTTVFKCN